MAVHITYYSARIFLTNRAFATESGTVPERTLGLTIGRSIAGGVHEDIEITNNSMRRVSFQLEIAVRSDFADLFEVKSNRIVRRGQDCYRMVAPATTHSYDLSQWRFPPRDRAFNCTIAH